MRELHKYLDQLEQAGEACAVATVIETHGSASARPGSAALIDRRGRVVSGWVGGGCAQSTVCHTALECLRDGTTRIVDLNLDDEVLGTGMPCGGTMRVFVEPKIPRPTLWILGHGSIVECLCRMASLIGFRTVIDDPMAEPERYPDADRILLDDDMDYRQLTPAEGDCAIVATQHKGDHRSMLRLVASPAAYIALIASTKRSILVLDYLREEGVTDEQLARVHAPAGLHLGAETPEEIALSVLSEIVMHRRGGNGTPMRIPPVAHGACSCAKSPELAAD